MERLSTIQDFVELRWFDLSSYEIVEEIDFSAHPL